MQSLAYIPASNGATNASLMTVQNVRSPGASDIIVNTVTGAPTKFYASMGAPHTFTDPVTGETITIISEATAVDFAGHLDSGKIVIDAIAPGYTDTRGSLVGDIVVIRPITEWANNIFNVLSQSLNDNGTIKDSAITYNANVFDHVASGAEMAGISYGVNTNASLAAGVAYINGIRQVIPAVASRTYTASKDTYVDALYNASGTATIVYTEVANNAASPALAANSIRLGIIVTGASSIANVGSVNQGQEHMAIPIISALPMSFTDSLGNIICPRDPRRLFLNMKQRTTQAIATSGTTFVELLEMAMIVKVPANRKIRVTVNGEDLYASVNNASALITLWEGAVSSGRKLLTYRGFQNGGSGTVGIGTSRAFTPLTSNPTIRVALSSSTTGNATIDAVPDTPLTATVELV